MMWFEKVCLFFPFPFFLVSPHFNHVPYRTVPCYTFNLQLWFFARSMQGKERKSSVSWRTEKIKQMNVENKNKKYRKKR